MADAEQGFYAIESRKDGSYSPPITLPLSVDKSQTIYNFSTQEDLPRPIAMAVFTMGGVRFMIGWIATGLAVMLIMA